jgi:hypothetical protein
MPGLPGFPLEKVDDARTIADVLGVDPSHMTACEQHFDHRDAGTGLGEKDGTAGADAPGKHAQRTQFIAHVGHGTTSFIHPVKVPEPQQRGIDPSGAAEGFQPFHAGGAGQPPPVGAHDAVHLDPGLTHGLISAGSGDLTGPLERPVIGARAQSQGSGKNRE